jgi:hypothetical protein
MSRPIYFDPQWKGEILSRVKNLNPEERLRIEVEKEVPYIKTPEGKYEGCRKGGLESASNRDKGRGSYHE